MRCVEAIVHEGHLRGVTLTAKGQRVEEPTSYTRQSLCSAARVYQGQEHIPHFVCSDSDTPISANVEQRMLEIGV